MSPEPIRDLDTRERLLRAGMELFGKKGFNGTGLTEVLAKAEVPKGSFYHHYGSKEDFGVAVIERARDEHLDEMRPLLSDRRLTPLQRLRAMFEKARCECAAAGTNTECLIPKLALETSSLSDPVHTAVRCAYQLWSAMLAQVIREGLDQGEIDRKHDADRLANLLIMLWEGAAIRMQIDRHVGALDDFQAFVFDTLLGRPGAAGG